MWPIAILAILVLAVDVLVHSAAAFGFNPQDWTQPDWVAAVILWVLFILMVLIANAVEARQKRQAELQGIIFPDNGNPGWFRRVMHFLIAYSLFNVIVFGFPAMHRGDPTQQGIGVYVLDPGHGHPVQPITKDQYDMYRRNGIRAISGLLLAFYVQMAFDMFCLASGKGKSSTSIPPRRRPFRKLYIIWTIRR
jgi:hypothetical protein